MLQGFARMAAVSWLYVPVIAGFLGLAGPAFGSCAGSNLIDALPEPDRQALFERAHAVPFAQGNLWRARREGEEITLIGTLHMDDSRHDATMAALGPAIAAAKAFIVETDSGAEVDGKTSVGTAMDGSDIDLLAPPYAVVGLDPGLDTEVGGIGYVDITATVLVRLVMWRVGSGQTPPEGTRTDWNLAGKVRAEMQAQVGGGTAFADAEVSSSGLAIDDPSIPKGHAIALLTITSRG
jgi:hypothetical protein